ncbi:MAG: 3-dehydroquinate synthase [bacterium]|nr:3-dehydroquinate synthase [bacterium]MCM1375786.1 3-dehydroquinate synthase [Muribaculum sp.]
MAQRLPILYKSKPCYDIYITRDFADVQQEFAPFITPDTKVCIVTDFHVRDLYANALKKELSGITGKVDIYAVPAGEEHKTLDTIRGIYTFLIQEKYGRRDCLVALGGGVVGDMTGFAAATYQRGVDYIQVPTTLLAQCDSSIGGKTGVDFHGYKNMVGAFKMPRLVYMNMSTLNTLEERQYFSGFAEVMKHGLIKDARFYTWLIDQMYEICERNMDVLEEMILRSCTVKKHVVEKDPTEQGDRMLLNYGHTIGHAIEKARNFELFHGECVALGAVAAAYISWKREMISMEEYYEVRDMFVPFNLPISVEDIHPEEVLTLMKSDKKAHAGTVSFILLERIGRAVIDETVSDGEILEAIREILFEESGD